MTLYLRPLQRSKFVAIPFIQIIIKMTLTEQRFFVSPIKGMRGLKVRPTDSFDEQHEGEMKAKVKAFVDEEDGITLAVCVQYSHPLAKLICETLTHNHSGGFFVERSIKITKTSIVVEECHAFSEEVSDYMIREFVEKGLFIIGNIIDCCEMINMLNEFIDANR